MTALLGTTAVHVGDFKPGSPEWHAARAKGLGGSEIAPVLGLSPWESRFSLWHRKTGLANPVVENDAMEWGKRLEASIREKFNERRAENGLPPANVIGTWRHRDRPWQIANPDGHLPGGELLEIKTARTDDGWGTAGTDQIPVYYRTQVLWYLDVFGYQRAHVAVLIGGSEYREYQVEASPAEAEFMRERAAEFLDTVQRGERPNIDAHDQTYQVIRELHPDIEDVTVEVPANVAVPYLDAIAAVKAAEAVKKQATSVLADFVGSARRATYLDQLIADRRVRAGGTPYLQATSRRATGQKVSAA